MVRLAWLLVPIYCKCSVDVLNIWGRGSVTGPWITGDCCWVTVCGFTQPRWMRPAISLADRLRGPHSWLVCHCRHQPSVFVSCQFFPHFLFDWLRLHMCWLFSVFWWLGVFHLRLSILLIWLLLLPQTLLGLWHFFFFFKSNLSIMKHARSLRHYIAQLNLSLLSFPFPLGYLNML